MSLAGFIREAWHVVEPVRAYVHGWHIDAMCQHLEAITDGRIIRLLINVPPGTMKSLLVNVFWPAWEWGPKGMAHLAYLAVSHSVPIAGRDNLKMRRLVTSDWYQQLWGATVRLTKDQNEKVNFENTATGARFVAAGSTITGRRADRILVDDPHSVASARSEATRAKEVENFFEAVSNRTNDPATTPVVVIKQRLHEADVSGAILDRDTGDWVHLCLPMEFEPDRRCETAIGFVDPRETEGELLFPERFPRHVVEREKINLGAYGTAGQLQQRPEVRGGGILKRADWSVWDDDEARRHGSDTAKHFPPFDLVVASLDPAYTAKQENDASGFTIWGLWRDVRGRRCAMLCYAWADHLELHACVERVAKDCRRFKANHLLIEAKASGISIAQEIRRLHANEAWTVHQVDPAMTDKQTRAWRAQPMFEAGAIWVPAAWDAEAGRSMDGVLRVWADLVVSQCAMFPRGARDDLVDSTTQALNWLRDRALLSVTPEEITREADGERAEPAAPPLYPV